MIDPQLLESLTDIDFMPENQFPRKFDLKKFDLAINAYRELFTEILGGKSELEDELMYVPRENQNAFLVRFGKKLEKLLQLALAKR